MKKFIFLILSLFLFQQNVHSVPVSDMRNILMKENAQFIDGLYLLLSMRNPYIKLSYDDETGKVKGFEGISKRQYEKIINNAKIRKRFKQDQLYEEMTLDDFSILVIELGLVRPGVFYVISGMKRYARSTMRYHGITTKKMPNNKILSGKEVIEMVTLVREKNGMAGDYE